MDNIVGSLNEAQKIAVTSRASVVQVLAPPGSGKTKTLTSRVAYLIAHHGFDPARIIVCTFTIKSAREMRERIEGFLGVELSKKLKLGTFHSICRRLLNMYGNRIGIDKKFGIADTSDSQSIVSRIIKRNQYDIDPSNTRSRISRLKSDPQPGEASLAASQPLQAEKADMEHFAKVYAEYEDRLKVSNLLDYDDLLLRCTELLRRFPQCVAGVEAVLVDEFQDTNHVQYDLMNLFAQSKQRITIVGDPDQSIYGWRCAKIENLQKMQVQYPEVHIVKLEENYRSSACILLAAQEVIDQDTNRPQKSLAPTHSAGEQPTLRRLYSAAEEAEWIVSEIKRNNSLTGGLLKWNDFAVLLRTASLSRLIENELGKAGIPYHMVGGLRFYDRAEVKVVLDYLRVIDLPSHSDALERIINVPPRRVGQSTIARLLSEADRRNMTLWTVISGIAKGTILPPTEIPTQSRRGLESFVWTLSAARKRLSNEFESSLAQFIQWFVVKIDLYGHLKRKHEKKDEKKKEKKDDHEARWGNVQELIAQASEFEQVQESGDLHVESDEFEAESERRASSSQAVELQQFLYNVALATNDKQNTEEGDPRGLVTLSTVHAAKGLEWPVVFIPAAYDGCFPHSRTGDHDEERRLLYVAMTRAKALLHMSCTTKNSRNKSVDLSRFLSPKTVAIRLANRGPKFTQDLVHELAKILGREAENVDLTNLVIKSPSLEDDQFPQDSDRIRLDQLRGETGDECEDFSHETMSHQQPSNLKRRWPDNTSTHRPVKRQYGMPTSNDYLVTTTMQRPESYSVAKVSHDTTFVSARTLPQQDKENEPPTSESKSDRTTPTVQARTRIEDGQRDIMGFLDPRSAQRASADSAFQPVGRQDPRSNAQTKKQTEVRDATRDLSAAAQKSSPALVSGNTAATDIPLKARRRLGARPSLNSTWNRRISKDTA